MADVGAGTAKLTVQDMLDRRLGPLVFERVTLAPRGPKWGVARLPKYLLWLGMDILGRNMLHLTTSRTNGRVSRGAMEDGLVGRELFRSSLTRASFSRGVSFSEG